MVNNSTESSTEALTGAVEKLTDQSISLPVGAIVAIIAVLAAVAVLVVILLIALRRTSKKREQESDLSDGNEYEEEESHTISPLASGNDAIKVEDSPESCPLEVASIHDVGRREIQQDSFGISDLADDTLVQSKGVLAVVADGMGGLSDGERMSQMVVVNMLQGFDVASPEVPGDTLLLNLVDIANDAVNRELGEEKIGKCGSTLVAVNVRDNRLFWISVGDSHIYVYRNGDLVKLNRDHNYGAQLDESAARGEITMEEALADKQRAALTSFIGIGELDLIDQNTNAVALEKGDRILLMSDGIYGTVPYERLREILGEPLKQACLLIEKEIHEKNKANQDNYTCVILEMR